MVIDDVIPLGVDSEGWVPIGPLIHRGTELLLSPIFVILCERCMLTACVDTNVCTVYVPCMYRYM